MNSTALPNTKTRTNINPNPNPNINPNPKIVGQECPTHTTPTHTISEGACAIRALC